MLRLWKYTLFFLLCLVIALLFNLPIQQVLPYVRLPDTVRLAGIDGTVISGTAVEVSVNEFPLREIEYRYLPSCIPLLKICYRIDYSQGRVRVAYDLLNGDTEVANARIEYPVTELTRHMSNLVVQPVGRLELEIDEMSIVAGRPLALNGRLVWRDFGLDDDNIRLVIGDYQVDFTGDSQTYYFEMSDLSGSLDVDGEGTIGNGGQYTVDIRIIARDDTEPQVRNVLGLVAKNISYNNYRVEQTGRLPPVVARQLFR